MSPVPVDEVFEPRVGADVEKPGACQPFAVGAAEGLLLQREEGTERSQEEEKEEAAPPSEAPQPVPPQLPPLLPQPQVLPLWGEALWEHCSASLVACTERKPIFIFDWDDTLFPTTALTAEGHFAAAMVPADQREQFDRLVQLMHWSHRQELEAVAHTAAAALKAARRCGHVFIVTNAIHGWVQSTCTKFLPELLEELAEIPVISARSIFEPQGFADPARWKEMCFTRIAKCTNLGQGEAGHFISIGDSWHERAAAMMVGYDASTASLAKSLKLLERPSICQISQQLEVVVQWVEHLASFAGHLDLAMQDGMFVGELVLPGFVAAIEEPPAAEAPAAQEGHAEEERDEEASAAEVAPEVEVEVVAACPNDVSMQVVLDEEFVQPPRNDEAELIFMDQEELLDMDTEAQAFGGLDLTDDNSEEADVELLCMQSAPAQVFVVSSSAARPRASLQPPRKRQWGVVQKKPAAPMAKAQRQWNITKAPGQLKGRGADAWWERRRSGSADAVRCAAWVRNVRSYGSW